MSEKLVAYYLGTLEESERLLVEDELLDSKLALMEFIALKRSLELRDDPAPEPSRSLKIQLMKDVSAHFEKSRVPVPLRAAFAFAAAVVVMLGAYTFFKSHHTSEPSTPTQASGVSVDSSNSVAVNLNVI